MKHLYYCRHGESVMNKAGLFASFTDTPLTDSGREQAKLEGQRAKNHGIDLIVSSPLSRALETAQIIANELKIPLSSITTNDLLVERNLGELEGTPYDSTMKSPYPPSVESDEALILRAQKAAAWLETLPYTTILVVAHGGFGRALRYVYLPEVDFAKRMPNAEIIKLV